MNNKIESTLSSRKIKKSINLAQHRSKISYHKTPSSKIIGPSCDHQTLDKKVFYCQQSERKYPVQPNMTSKTVSDEDNSKYAKNYCVDFQAVIKRISKACKQKISNPSKFSNKSQEISELSVNQLPTESKIASSQDFNQEKGNPQSTFQSDIFKNVEDKAYPKMITYSGFDHYTIRDKINYHLDALEHLIVFIENINLQYSSQNPWDKLILMLYKQYYKERIKVEKFFKKYPIKSPFKFNNCSISTNQMLQFVKKGQGKDIIKEIQFKNKQIQSNIQEYYHKKKIYKANNDQQNSDFLSQNDGNQQSIMKNLWQYILVYEANKKTLKHPSFSYSSKQQKYCKNNNNQERDQMLNKKSIEKQNLIDKKIGRALQIGFLIAEIHDFKNPVDIEVSQGYISCGMAKGYINQYRQHFRQMIQNNKCNF